MLRRSLLCRGATTEYKGLVITHSKNVLQPNAPGVATITLTRPKQKNSISKDMYVGITEFLLAAKSNADIGAIILTGSAETDYYCSGNDLKNLMAFAWPRTLAADAREMCFDFVQSFVDCEKPIVAAVTGPAIGIAVTTLSLCDYRYCTASATFNTPFKALAQAPEGCSSYLFPEIMGKDMARKMLVDGYTMSSEEAVKFKFMHEAFADRAALKAKSEETAHALACGKLKLADGQRYCTKNKDMLRNVNNHECDILQEAWVSRECLQALINFFEKKNNKSAARALRLLNSNAARRIWDNK